MASSPRHGQIHVQYSVLCYSFIAKGKKVKVDFQAMYRHLHEHEQQRFTMRSGVLTCNDTGGAAQVAATHCPNERTLDPAVCRWRRGCSG